MAWSIDTHNLKQIHSFAAAEKFWQDSKPFKNQDKSWRPLDNVRMPHKRLVKRDDGGYDCVLYNTAIVKYYPDGVELDFYGTTSTKAFAWCVSPNGCSMVSANGVQFWQVTTPEGERYYPASMNPVRLKLLADGCWKLDGPVNTAHHWAYDPKLGAAARRIIKPYKSWFEVSVRLGAKLISNWITPKPTSAHLDLLIAAPDNVIIFPKLVHGLGKPQDALAALYRHMGAQYRAAVPHDRLPGRNTI